MHSGILWNLSVAADLIINVDTREAVQYRIATRNHFKPKSREIPFACNLFRNCSIVLKFYTEHGGDTGVLFVKFRNDWATETDVTEKRGLVIFEFEVSFWRISQFAQSFCFLRAAELIMSSEPNCTSPADTLRNNDVITSKWRHFDAITSKWRHFDVIMTLSLRNVFSDSCFCGVVLTVCPVKYAHGLLWFDFKNTD